MNQAIRYYDDHADELFHAYDSLDAYDVHGSWVERVRYEAGIALDVGAGSGRDAAYLAGRGFEVIAVEPAAALRQKARATHPSPRIQWIDDRLPDLKEVEALGLRFDLILVSAVWQHVSPVHRERVFRKLANLLKPEGQLVVTLRLGPPDTARRMHEVSIDELRRLGLGQSLSLELDDGGRSDYLGREEITWQTLVFKLADDGTGALPLLRHIIVNDNKSATYKLALLRTLIRCADAHPGMVIHRTEDQVEIPAGLVALMWIQLFRPLVVDRDLPQTTNPARGMGFAGDAFWTLTKRAAGRLSIGDHFEGDMAQALHRALTDVRSNIRQMPAHYITWPGTNDSVFEVRTRRTRAPDSVVLDTRYLASFGTFAVPAALWDAMARFAYWLEPAISQTWVDLMIRYDEARGVTRSREEYHLALDWRPDERCTRTARSIAESLKNSGHRLHCVWSGRALNAFEMDHCIPYALWQNNDLWNLLPASRRANNLKRDRLPSAGLLADSKHRIQHWWSDAYEAGQFGNLFRAQARSSLAVADLDLSMDLLFDALQMQRLRVKDFHRATEWEG